MSEAGPQPPADSVPPGPLMLLDTASLYFRAYYGVPASVRAPSGEPVNAVRGLLDFMARLLRDHRPSGLVACWDEDWRPDFRVRALPSYKAHRVAIADDHVETDQAGHAVEATPDDLLPQIEVIKDVLAALGIARVGAPGYEADDVIGTLAATARGPVLIVTGDRDLFQLVDDERGVRVLYTAARGVGRAELIDEAAVVSRYGVAGREYADFATLRGDPSDGLPGIAGVGEKTAAGLIREFGSVDAVVAAAADPATAMPGGLRRRITGAGDYLARARLVVPVVRDVPVGTIDARIPPAPADPGALDQLARRWGLGSSLTRLITALRDHGRTTVVLCGHGNRSQTLTFDRPRPLHPDRGDRGS